MMLKKIIFFLLFPALVSCSQNRAADKPEQATPKALEEKGTTYKIISRSGRDDLMESLYAELVSKNVDLQQLEFQIDALKKSKTDATNSFDNFNAKNESYFNSAGRHIAGIKDSLLREQMKALVANNVSGYHASIRKHREFLKLIESKELAIADLHTILKIVKTLPLMEKYQSDNLPGTKSLEGYINRQNEAIKLADTLTKKLLLLPVMANKSATRIHNRFLQIDKGWFENKHNPISTSL